MFIKRSYIDMNQDILDTPEFFEYEKEYEHIYNYSRKYFAV